MKWQIVIPAQIVALSQKMRGWRAIIVDVESTGTDWFLEDRPVGIGLSPFDEEKYYYLPLEGLSLHDIRPIIEVLEEKPLIGHNIKFDLHMLWHLGWRGRQESFFDTIVMARLWCTEDKPRLGLKELVERIFGFHWPDEKVVRAVKSGNLLKIPLEKLAYYCCIDVWATKELYKFFKRELNQELLALYSLETHLTRDLFNMETRGILVDQEYLASATKRLDEELEMLLERIVTASGIEDFNPGSTPQKRELMEKLGIHPVKMAKTGPSWDRDALLAVRHKHPIALDLAKRQALAYQRNGLIERAIQSGGILHGEFKNWGTVTGRLSSDLQQLPKGWLQFGEADETGEGVLVWLEDDKAEEKEFSIRRFIRPRPGHVLIKADYHQIEMFVLAFYMKDPTFDRWIDSGNVHAAAALEVFGDAERYYNEGKTYNFATIYGQGDQARAKALGCSVKQSKIYRRQYDQKMPGYKSLLNRIRRKLSRDGFIKNVFDRYYWLDPNLAYRGVNYICQGSAGDHVKFKLPTTRELRAQIGCEVLITTHDDFIAEIPEENVRSLPEWLAELQKSPFNRDLGLEAEYSRESMVQLHPLEELLV